MSSPRFYVARLPQSGCVQLDAAEARHAASVLRLEIGASVVLFDGLGGEAIGVVAELDKRLIQIDIESRTNTDRELHAKLELIVALPKGDRQKTLLEGLVQLGVTQLTPLASNRAVAQPTPAAMERLERTIVEASKQCGRNRLMQLGEAVTVRELAEQQANVSERLFAHPYGDTHPLGTRLASADRRIAIGPEGGFTDQECDCLTAAGWTAVGLGPRILRIEMAALMCAAAWAVAACETRLP